MRATKLIANASPFCFLLLLFYHFPNNFQPACTLRDEDGQTLPINRRQRAYNNGTLIIEQLQRLEDAGTYTCMAQNKQKQTSRRNVEIQVLGKFPARKESLSFSDIKILKSSG